ncbi:MAG: glutamate mutase L [Phototrophicaceae bacterium]
MASSRVSSILAADFGSVQTRVVLFDVVEGEYRLVAHAAGRTTLGYPDDDLHVGLRRLLEEISAVSGRNFYNQVGRIVTPEDRSRNGVDYFITTASSGKPIRTIIVGLVPEVSISSALRATSGTYIDKVAEFHLRDGYSEEERLNAVIVGRPDLIFVTGGTDGGAVQALQGILDVIELGLRIQERELRPPILYAGNRALQAYITERFSDLTDVIMSDNIRPTIDQESIDAAQVALGKAFDDHNETQGIAFSTVGEMSSTGLLPTAESYRLVADYLAKTRRANVMIADVGSTSTILVSAFNGDTNAHISTTKGLGQSALTLLNDVGEAAIAEWLPYYPIGSEIRNYMMNKVARPASIPMDLREMFMEQAMMRAALRQMVATNRAAWQGVNPMGTLPPVDLIVVGGGALNGTGNPAYDIMLIADSLQPTGITEIKADRHGIIPAMSAIARTQPDAMVQLIDGDNLEHLGSLINLTGSSGRDGIAAKLVIITDDEPFKYDLRVGEYLSLPLPQSFSLAIKIRCQGNFRVNGKRNLNVTLNGGTAGIIIDGRGRPLAPIGTVEERMQILPNWIASATDTEAFDLPDEWRLNPNNELEAVQLRRTQEMKALFEPIGDEADGDSFDDSNLEALDITGSDVDLDDLFGDDADHQEPEEDDDDLDSLRGLFD